MFALEGAGFAIGDRALLHPLDLDIQAGRMVGLIGHNGSGKSTLLKLLARQTRPSSGRICFEGCDLSRWRTRAFARRVAYLPQDPPVAPGMLVRELAGLGRHPWTGPLAAWRGADHGHVARALAATGTSALAGRAVETLSGGERQRAWLAMVLAQDTGFLLLDEPISALDIRHQVEVMDLLSRLCRERGIGVVVVLHDVNLAARHCDDILALHGGRLIARGPPEAVMTPARLEAIYGLRLGVMRHPVTGGFISYV